MDTDKARDFFDFIIYGTTLEEHYNQVSGDYSKGFCKYKYFIFTNVFDNSKDSSYRPFISDLVLLKQDPKDNRYFIPIGAVTLNYKRIIDKVNFILEIKATHHRTKYSKVYTDVTDIEFDKDNNIIQRVNFDNIINDMIECYVVYNEK